MKSAKLTLFLSLIGLVFLTPSAFAQLQYGDFYYTVSEGTVTITGYNIHAPGGAIVIPATIEGMPVVSIGNMSFFSCYSLTSVTIPDSITSIGDNAFDSCYYLTSVNIPNSVTSIGDRAFWYCMGLTSLNIPDSVISIGNNAFAFCLGLTSATVPNSIISIEDGLFQNCSSLTSVTIPNSVTSIGDWAFAGCTGLTSVTIPNSVTSIGDNTFSHCSGLISVFMFGSVTSIGGGAFEYCTNLTSVNIPGSVTSIGNMAFSYCSSLTKAYFFGNAPSMGGYVFLGCSSDFTVCYSNRSAGFTSPTWCPTYDQCYQAEMCILVDSPCPCVKIYGENSDETELLREYRDNVLSKTPEGQELIKTYYKVSPTVTKLLENRPLLKVTAKVLIDSMLPGIRKKLEECNKKQ
jgi:hypothetical protein